MTEGQAPTEAAPVADAAPAVEQEAPAAVESVLDADIPQTDSFDRTYVEKLRQEAGNYRTRYKAVEDWAKIAEDYRDDFASPQDLRGFLDQFRSRDGILNFYADMTRRLREAGVPVEQLLTPQQPEADADRPLTVREFQQMTARQQAQLVAAREDQEVSEALKEFGVSDEARNLVIAAAMKYPRNLGYRERIRRGSEDFRKQLESHAASLSQAEQENAAKAPGSIGGSPAVASEEPPSDWAAARKRAAQLLDGIVTADHP